MTDPRPSPLPELLIEAALHHRRHASRQAALTLLSRTPDLTVSQAARLFESATRDSAIVRRRALLVMPQFRSLRTEAGVEEVLRSFAQDGRAGAKLAKAQILATLVRHNALSDADARRRVVRELESAAWDPANRLPIAVVAGSGADNDPRVVQILGRLDTELQELLPQLSLRPM